jgi:hypothetical protein
MSQKKTDNLGQSEPLNEEFKSIYVKGSIVEYLRSRGINSRDTTLEKLGQSKLLFTSQSKSLKNDDAFETSIKYLKFRKSNS